MCSCGLQYFEPIDSVIDITLTGNQIKEVGQIATLPGQVTIFDGCGIAGGDEYTLYELRNRWGSTVGWFVQRPDDYADCELPETDSDILDALNTYLGEGGLHPVTENDLPEYGVDASEDIVDRIQSWMFDQDLDFYDFLGWLREVSSED